MARVLVTDGNERAALAIARSLGRRGFTVIVGADRARSLAAASRYCAGEVTYPSASRDPDRFDRALLDLVLRKRIDVVLPVTDVTTEAVARRQREIYRCGAAAPVPPWGAFTTAGDKHQMLECARACGMDVPRSVVVNGAGALKAVLPQVRYPAVIKPARSHIRTARGWMPTCVRYARTEAELLRVFAATPALAHHRALIQERLVGPGLGLFVICDHGRILTAFAHRRLREKPPSGGISVLSESVAVDAVLLKQAQRLLAPLDWHGVAMVEYKHDAPTGRTVLMEVNGRFWGSLQLAIDAGVDFPYLSCQLALGQRLDLPRAYAVGVRTRWLLGDLDHLLARLTQSRADVPAGMPSRSRALLDFLASPPPWQRQEILRRDDPKPAWREMRQYLGAIAASAAERLRRRRPAAAPSLSSFDDLAPPDHADALG